MTAVRLLWRAGALVGVVAGGAACAHAQGAQGTQATRVAPQDESAATGGDVQVGFASWYGRAFAGRKTASGERFDPAQMTAAHRTLPFGTWVEVKRVDTGAAVRVRITDRGPFGHDDRVIDLSEGAAERIGMKRAGVARVQVRVVAGEK